MLSRVAARGTGVSCGNVRSLAMIAAVMVVAVSAAPPLAAGEPEQRGGRRGGGGGGGAPNEAAALTQEGVELVAEQKYEEALEAFDKAIEADPKFGMAYYQKGRALALSGDMKGAQETLLQSTRLQPGFAHGHQLAAAASQQLEDWDAAWDQAVRAVIAGAEPGNFGGLQQAHAAPANVQELLSAWKVFVVGIDTRELMAGDQGPNDRSSGGPDEGTTDIRSTLGQLQGELFEMQLLVTNAISDTPGFGLVPNAEMAQYLLVIRPDEIDADPRHTMEGEIRLLAVADNSVAFQRPVTFRNLSAESAVTTEIQQFIDLLENWKAQQD